MKIKKKKNQCEKFWNLIAVIIPSKIERKNKGENVYYALRFEK